MARIVWTNAEKDAIFARMELVYRQNPNATRKAALREAQTVLSASRWIVVTDQRVFNYRDRIEVARQNAMRMLKKTPEKRIEPPAPMLAPPPVPERNGDPKANLGAIFEALIDAIADRVVQRLAPPPQSSTDAPAPEPQYEPQYDRIEARRNVRERENQSLVPLDRRPGVLIVGLLNDQAQSISLEYMDRLSLSYRSTDAAKREPVLRRDHTVLMVKFISHSVHEKYKGVRALYLCNGGMTDLRKYLDSIASPVV